MPGSNPATVLFDWDGTLFDSGAASLRAFRKSLAEFGFEFTDPQYKAVYTPLWYRMYEEFGLPREVWEQCDRRWLHHYGSEQPGLVPGAEEVLAELAGRQIPAGIVTNGTRTRVQGELARLGLANTFCAVVCHEDVAHPKPHPEGILKALAMAGSPPESCCYVGDTAVDMESGHNAGVFTVGILTDYVDPATLSEGRPNLLLRHIAELPAALYRFTSIASWKMPGGS